MELNTIKTDPYVVGQIIPAEAQRAHIELNLGQNRTSEQENNILHEKALKDAEFVKRFLYMLAGIPYESPEKAHVSRDGSRWA